MRPGRARPPNLPTVPSEKKFKDIKEHDTQPRNHVKKSPKHLVKLVFGEFQAKKSRYSSNDLQEELFRN